MTQITPFFILCVTGLVAIFSSTMSKSPVLPLFAKQLGTGEAYIGFIAAASTVVGILTSLPAGVLSDLYGRRRVILASMVIFASAPFLYLLVQTPRQLVAVRAYHGLATAILGPVALAAVADMFSAQRGENMAWYSSATLVGRFLAPLMGGFILSLTSNSYKSVYLACGLGGVLALLVASRLPTASLGRRGGGSGNLGGSWRQMRKGLHQVVMNRGILVISMMEAAQRLAFGCVEVFLPLYALLVGIEPWQIGVLLGGQTLTTGLSGPFMGRLSDRIGRKPLIVAGLGLCAVAMVAMPLTGSFLLLLALSISFGLGIAAVASSTSALVSDLSQASAYGSALGVLSTIMDVGHASGPMAAGLLVANFNYPTAFATLAVVLVIAAIIFWAIVHEPSRK